MTSPRDHPPRMLASAEDCTRVGLRRASAATKSEGDGMAQSSDGRRGASSPTAVRTATRTGSRRATGDRNAAGSRSAAGKRSAAGSRTATSAGKTAGREPVRMASQTRSAARTTSKTRPAVRTASTATAARTASKTACAPRTASKPRTAKTSAGAAGGPSRTGRKTPGKTTPGKKPAVPAAGRAAEAVLDAAQRLPGVPALTARLTPPRGRAVAEVIKRPEAVLRRARQLPMAAAMLRDAVAPILTGKVDDWRAEYAYATGVQAFIYGFPYIYNARLRHNWVTGPAGPAAVPYAPVNHFWHATKPADAAHRDGSCPNNDTLYSLAWVDVSREPAILSHPNMGNRYFTFELMAFSSDNFGYVGQRSTGSGAGHFAITGPGWKGSLPAGVKKTRPSPTPWLLVLGRTLVDGQQDVPSVRALQEQYRLTPLSKWGKPRAKLPRRRAVYAPADPRHDPLAPWKSLNTMLAENPPPPHHALLLDQFARIGIGPGLDVAAQPESVRRGLIRAAAVAMPLLRQQFLSGGWATAVNGWRYRPQEEVRFGDDFLRRAADQSLAGISADDPAEAVYLVSFDDAAGRRLSPKRRYRLRFGPGELPPVDAFWSLTAYTEQDMSLIPNPAGSYSVGDRTPGLKREPDGGLTIYLQPGSPGSARAANWLPTSGEHPWFVILRMYRPRRSVLQAKWRCPGLVKVT